MPFGVLGRREVGSHAPPLGPNGSLAGERGASVRINAALISFS